MDAGDGFVVFATWRGSMPGAVGMVGGGPGIVAAEEHGRMAARAHAQSPRACVRSLGTWMAVIWLSIQLLGSPPLLSPMAT